MEEQQRNIVPFVRKYHKPLRTALFLFCKKNNCVFQMLPSNQNVSSYIFFGKWTLKGRNRTTEPHSMTLSSY